MTKHEFVRSLWENSDDYSQPMTLDTATQDLETFHNDGWDIPEGLTAEEYMEIWNGLVKEQGT